MGPALTKIPFSPELHARDSVTQFSCGSLPYESEVADWLKAPLGAHGALDDLASASKLDIFLYLRATTGELVGVGSLGRNLLGWPRPSSDRVPVWCIPNLGIDARFKGQGYGRAILEDLLLMARTTAPELPIYLAVRVDNPAADFYAMYGFRPYGKAKKEEGKADLQRMLLNPPVLSH